MHVHWRFRGTQCVTNFRWAVSLSGFANMNTKITTQREFRLSLSFLLSENNQRFRSAKVKVNSAQRFLDHQCFITALHVMQTRYCDENFVCPSVCPSVRLADAWFVTKWKKDRIFIPYERTFSLVFWEEEWLMADDPFYVKFWVNRPPFERNRWFSTNNRS